jgi:hypothetical protein
MAGEHRVAAGDVVSVRITLTKANGCGSTTHDLCIGTFRTACPVPVGAGGARFCPFVPSLAAGDYYTSALVISNTGAVPGTVTVTATKKDGTTATFTTPVIGPAPAATMYSNLLGLETWVGTTPAGVPASLAIQSSAGMTIDSFVMLWDGATNSSGYLCR